MRPQENATFRNTVILIVGLFLVWELAYLVVGDVALRSPWQTVKFLGKLMRTDLFWLHLADSLKAFAVALAIAVVLGLLIGFALGLHRLSGEAMEPMLVALYSIPKITLYPIILLAFGIGISAKIAFGAIHGIIPVALFTLNGLDRVPPVLKKTARVNGLNALQTARHVTLPFCAPYLLTAAKLALAYAFIGVIGSEFIMARSGMGYEISYAYTNFDNATMYPLILLILLLSIAANSLLSRWERILLARRGQA